MMMEDDKIRMNNRSKKYVFLLRLPLSLYFFILFENGNFIIVESMMARHYEEECEWIVQEFMTFKLE